KKKLPFEFSPKLIRFDKAIIARELRLGIPISLQDLLVSISFLFIQMVVNKMGVIESAGIGIGEKVCLFIMLVPIAYTQSMSAFVAQNIGAKRLDRARRALLYGIITSLMVGVVMAWLAFFHGDMLANIFTQDQAVIAAAHSYLKAYAIDCFIISSVFCFIGYYNGCGNTLFVMLQGIIGAFCVRIPVVIFMSGLPNVTLFMIGLGTPASSLAQLIMCLIMFALVKKKMEEKFMGPVI
ncbi:MAG: MATE family efflux transporter, partial [Lachnospiraceae bacterium]